MWYFYGYFAISYFKLDAAHLRFLEHCVLYKCGNICANICATYLLVARPAVLEHLRHPFVDI